jgi:hypothetical protein
VTAVKLLIWRTLASRREIPGWDITKETDYTRVFGWKD